MLVGAALMVGFQIISIQSAFKSINLDVIGFLFGMFSIVSALDKSGVLKLVSTKMLSRTENNPDLILMVFVVGMGLLSAFLVNDTIALLGIPLVIYVSKRISIRSSILLIALSFGITVGSTMTTIGNPQNLLIALQSGIPLPFTTFLRLLGIPTIVNLFVTYFILKVYYRKEFLLIKKKTKIITTTNNHHPQSHSIDKKQQYIKEENLISHDADDPNEDATSLTGASIVNPRLAKLSIVILSATIAGFIISETIQFAFHIASLSLSVIAMLGATALYALSSQRRNILVSVDYSVLVFFAAMFVFTSGLWSSGIISLAISHFPSPDRHNILQSNAIISAISIALSQVLSNVPFVAIYNTVMINNGFVDNDGANTTSQWMMLAAASTIAGNLTILAAASNIIIIEAAESRGIKAFTFFEFFKIGGIVTLANIAIYYLFICFI
jgi:Na+/H+ antiporter NhaD/arsenite permease-like protein